jgi:hypothetical protein
MASKADVTVAQCDRGLEAVDLSALPCPPESVGTLNLSENNIL